MRKVGCSIMRQFQWGSLRYSANTAFIAGIYSDTVNDYNDR